MNTGRRQHLRPVSLAHRRASTLPASSAGTISKRVGTIELLITHATGVVEIYYGTPLTQTSWELATDIVMRTSTAKEVTAAKRLYGLVNDGDLAYVEERAMVGEPLQPHVSAQLERVVG